MPHLPAMLPRIAGTPNIKLISTEFSLTHTELCFFTNASNAHDRIPTTQPMTNAHHVST